MHNVWITASSWLGVAFLASLISIRIGVSVALVEIILGYLLATRLDFIRMTGSIFWRRSARCC